MPARTGPLAFLAALVVCIGLLSACSGPMPLYASAAADLSRYSFTYGQPANRSDQIIYRELRLRLPREAGATQSYTVAVTSSTTARKLVNSPNSSYEMVASANVVVTRADGKRIFAGRRTASAAYSYVSQVLADKQAEVDAAERASIALAETIRLTILSALGRG